MLILTSVPHTNLDQFIMLMKPQQKRGFQKWLADALEITQPHLSMIVNEKRSVSLDLALRLVNLLPDTNISFWVNMPLLKMEVCLWEKCKVDYMEYLAKTTTEKDNADGTDF